MSRETFCLTDFYLAGSTLVLDELRRGSLVSHRGSYRALWDSRLAGWAVALIAALRKNLRAGERVPSKWLAGRLGGPISA